MTKRLLAIGAHSADFVWRAAGTIAVATSQGGSATVLALSYGERGESGALWKGPHQPELCAFEPNTFGDITPVMERKRKAMEVMAAQSYLQSYYTELASRRGNHARRISGMQEVEYAEAMQRVLPQVVKSL